MDENSVDSSNHIDKPDINKIYGSMILALDTFLSSERKEDVSHHLAASMANMDGQTLSALLAQNVETEFGQKLFNQIINEIDDETYEIIAVTIMDRLNTTTAKYGDSDPAKVIPIRQVYQNMMNSARGIRLQSQIKKRQEQEKIKKEKQIADLKSLSVLLEEFESNEGEKREQVIPLLVQMGSAAVDPLLNMLKESDSMSLRAKIIQILSEIGPDAISGVTKRINDEEPWFYLRNLSRILGRIGDKNALEFLTKLLSHEEYRVQQEALNSIYSIGGEERETVFLSLLSTVDDRLKPDIVGILGALKSEKALPLLLEILETETFIAPKERITLGEKICNVFGNLKYEAAIPTLRAIVELKKGFLVKKTYSEKVQLAAEKALEMIQA